jgi:hypothetical protein
VVVDGGGGGGWGGEAEKEEEWHTKCYRSVEVSCDTIPISYGKIK